MTDRGPRALWVRLWGPDGVTVARFPVACAIVAVAFWQGETQRVALAVLVAVAVASDVVDGWWARRRGTASAHGAALDSAADVALAAAMALALAVTVELPPSAWLWWAIGVIVALRITTLCVLHRRFRAVSFAHSWPNKAAGAAASLAVIVALATARLDGGVTAGACIVAGIAAVDELLMAATAPSFDHDARWSGVAVGANPRRARREPRR